MRSISLKFCTFEIADWFCRTVFPDGTSVTAVPQDDDTEYVARALSLGYGTNTIAMCIEHEYLHNVLGELCFNGPSPALWDVAHGVKADRGWEEEAVLTLQRRLNELRKVTGGSDLPERNPPPCGHRQEHEAHPPSTDCSSRQHAQSTK